MEKALIIARHPENTVFHPYADGKRQVINSKLVYYEEPE
jgi:hypothetical protein